MYKNYTNGEGEGIKLCHVFLPITNCAYVEKQRTDLSAPFRTHLLPKRV